MLVETCLGIQYLSENYLAKTITVTTMRYHITQTASNRRRTIVIRSDAVNPIHGDGIEMSTTPAIRPSEADG